jgi:hypothetical protein
MGFCIYNNVGLAAKWVLQRFPRQVQKILIIDWDVQYVSSCIWTNIVMVTGRNEYSMKIRMFCIFLFIGMMTGRSVLSHLYVADLDPFTGSPYNVGAGAGVGRNVNITWDKHRDRPSIPPPTKFDT